MKKTQFIEMLKNFKKSFVTFFCIVVFVAFGIAAYLGLDWSKQAIGESFETYFQEGNLQEFELSYLYGITDSDIEYLETIPEFGEMEGRYVSYRFLNNDGQKQQIHLYSITDNVNKFTYLEGSLPTTDNEILVEKTYAEVNGIKIGDEIEFSSEGDYTDYQLKNDKFVVKGITKSAEYTSKFVRNFGINPTTGCEISGIMYLTKDAFSKTAYPGYSSVLIKCDKMSSEELFGDEFGRNASELTDSVKEKLGEHFQKKYLSLTPKSANISFVAAKTIADVFEGLRVPLAGLFVLVGALVCYFAISRNVFDQSKLIGTKKALGFHKGEILASMMLFSLISAVLGIILGVILARIGLEPILLSAVQENYSFNKIIYIWDIKEIIIFGLGELAIILLVTYIASRRILRRSANSLLTGNNVKSFKERLYMKTAGYNKMSGIGKIVINNILSEPRRVLSTIVGVMGITALIVCSISLNDFIQASFGRQMTEVTKYDTILYINQDKADKAGIEKYLDSKNIQSSEMMATFVTIKTPDDQRIWSPIYVVEDQNSFLKLFDLHDGKNKVENIDGLYSSFSYINEYGWNPGDEMEVIAFLNGQTYTLEIKGAFDYYLLQNHLIIDKDTYEKECDGEYNTNAILINRGNVSIEELTGELSEYEGFVCVSDYYGYSKSTFDSFASVFAIIVGVYIVLAVAMAFIVIMNLLDMFIKEKKYELIVLMVNGFKAKQVKAYIYIDTIILTIVGTALGLLLGFITGNISLDAAYNSACVYVQGGFDAQACIAGVGLTFLLVFIVLILSIRKISKFKLSDINS